MGSFQNINWNHIEITQKTHSGPIMKPNEHPTTHVRSHLAAKPYAIKSFSVRKVTLS